MLKNPKKVFNSVTEAVGFTPLIRVNRIPEEQDVKCQIWAKADFYSVGGSIKDRIGVYMIEAAEKRGRIKPGDTIVESTSGNTGIGLALAAAIKGYKLIITLPDKMSDEKVNTLRALGAQVIITPTDVPHEHPDSYTSVAARLGREPDCYHINQYHNPDNSMAHYLNTAEEILEQTDGQLDYLFVGAGTCGTISGVAKRLKEVIPTLKVIGVDPIGSSLARPVEMNSVTKSYKIEGVGQSLTPAILDYELVDGWIKVDDDEALDLARQMIEKEGLLVGGSCGTALAGTLNYLKTNGLHQNENLKCVVILPDSVRNYMTKLLNDNWMVGNGFFPVERLLEPQHPLADKTLADLPNLRPISYFDKRLTIADCFDLFKRGIAIIPIREAGEVIGAVTRESLLKNIAAKGLHGYSSCSHCIKRDFLRVG